MEAVLVIIVNHFEKLTQEIRSNIGSSTLFLLNNSFCLNSPFSYQRCQVFNQPSLMMCSVVWIADQTLMLAPRERPNND